MLKTFLLFLAMSSCCLAAPTFWVVGEDSWENEWAEFSIELNEPAPQDLTFNVSIVHIDTTPQDFSQPPVTNSVITIKKGKTKPSLTNFVRIKLDNLPKEQEDDEMYEIVVTSQGGTSNTTSFMELFIVEPIPGDSNLNGKFDSNDLILVTSTSKYETGEFATWVEGDWNRDGVFDSADLVLALPYYEE